MHMEHLNMIFISLQLIHRLVQNAHLRPQEMDMLDLIQICMRMEKFVSLYLELGEEQLLKTGILNYQLVFKF